MIVTQSVQYTARNYPDEPLAIQRGQSGYYINAGIRGEPLEYFTLRSDCVRALEENGYECHGRNRWMKPEI